jgi:hypothetical protein
LKIRATIFNDLDVAVESPVLAQAVSDSKSPDFRVRFTPPEVLRGLYGLARSDRPLFVLARDLRDPPARLASSPRGHIKVVTIEARATGVQQARDGSGHFAHEQA